MTGQSPAVWQLQISLGALQRLDRGLFVDTDDDRILRRRHVEPYHVGGLGGELGIVALAPGFAPRKVDLLGAQDAPDLLLVHVAQLGRNQLPGPTRESRWRRTIQHRQNTFTGLSVVLRHRTGSRFVGQAGQSLPAEPATPQTDGPRHRAHAPSDRPRRASFGRQQDDPRAKNVALFRRRCPNPSLKHRTILRRQPDVRSFGNHPDVES